LEGLVVAEQMVVIASRLGLHARSAAIFTEAAKKSGIEVTLATADGRMVDAASILAVMSLGINHGDVVLLTADGPGADGAIDALAAILRIDLDGVQDK
jgi:phosphocarrier protein HPr